MTPDIEPYKNWKIISKDGRVTILLNMTRGQAVRYSLRVMGEPDSKIEPADDE